MQWTADNLQGLPGPDGSLPGKSLVSPNQPESIPADDPLLVGVRLQKERIVLKFTDMNFHPAIQRGIRDMGFTEATPIQRDSIPMRSNARRWRR